MAINNIILKKVGRELREWVFLGIRTGMRRGVEVYRDSGNIEQLKRAIDMPHRARARVDEAIRIHGQSRLVDALSANNSGDVTIAELNAELSTLESYAQDLVDRGLAGETWDDLATDIEVNITLESEQWVFPFPAAYTDIWGE